MLKKLSLTVILTVVFWAPLQFSYADYDSFTVNVPDSHGGHRSIVIKKLGDGYIGPQGEHYSSFPTIDQLSAASREAPEERNEQRTEGGPVVQVGKTQITIQNIPIDAKDLKAFDFKKKKKSSPPPQNNTQNASKPVDQPKSVPSSQNGQTKKPDSSGTDHGNHT
jgi:hypothetical protein